MATKTKSKGKGKGPKPMSPKAGIKPGKRYSCGGNLKRK